MWYLQCSSIAALALPRASSRFVINFLLLCIPSSTHTLETDRVLYDVHSIKVSLMERLCGLCSRSCCHHSVSHLCCEGRCELCSCPRPLDKPPWLWQRAAAPRCARASSWGRGSICWLQTCVINVLGRYTWVWLSVTREPPQTCPAGKGGLGFSRWVVEFHPAGSSRQYPRSDHCVPVPTSIHFRVSI